MICTLPSSYPHVLKVQSKHTSSVKKKSTVLSLDPKTLDFPKAVVTAAHHQRAPESPRFARHRPTGLHNG